MDKNYRIHTNIASDTILNVNMQQDYDFLEVLTMKLRQKDAYKLHSSNYGVIIGRVLANDAFGIPNAKISVFVERDKDDSIALENIYPYSEVTSRDSDGRRYNLLPDYSNDDCYRIVGTFPNKRLVLDNDIQVEIYEKYWKYTTVTNNAGDYMIFGVPSGSQQIHVDIDLSDIGMLSQKPRDFEYKGYNMKMFDNPNQFKESTNLESLAQIFSQDKSVFVYPFWGDEDNGVAAITRSDVQIQYKFEPTCVFMGSIISDNEGNAIGHKCEPEVNNGMNNQLIAGEGTIEMIRVTQDGLVEEYPIQGNALIDSDGVWCYQIPMNLDYIGTDEYGNIVPTDNPSRGIPTRTQVRFRISKHDTGEEGFSHHTAKYLVPMNPIFSERESVESLESEERHLNGVQPVIETTGEEFEQMYNFGSTTPRSCFRDLYWNNVYSVKNYIPKVQIAHRPYSKNYSALKGSNLAEDKNPIPFNSLRVDLPFLYVIICIIFDIVNFIVGFINEFIICTINFIIEIINDIIDAINSATSFFGLFGNGLDIGHVGYVACIRLAGEENDLSDDTIFAPGCGCDSGQEAIENPYGKRVSSNKDELKDFVVEKLAEDFDIIKLDFYQDWINGVLYMPLWYWRKRKKKTYLFGLFHSRAKNQFCDCNSTYRRLRTYVTCNVVYDGNSLEITNPYAQVPEDDDWHRNHTDRVQYANGVIKSVENRDGLTAYYYAAAQATRENLNEEKEMSKRTEPFYAIRLYATDIILLGNLNEENLYGIPQFFRVLPSTTANIPQVATIQESKAEIDEDNEEEHIEPQEDYDKKYGEFYKSEDSGTTIVTGMNWRIDPPLGSDEPRLSWGLFMQLGCTEVITRAKSCFNAERLSELGVNLDMSYNMPFTIGSQRKVRYGEIRSDGFISKLELDDMENRAMFATMNHIGFVPQEYQDSISGYTTQVEDENTSYLVPKFRYIYPVDFDGRQQQLMNRYRARNFNQQMFDEVDESYLAFRFGADKVPENGERGRIRHFYNVNDEGYSMPVYNNSFFFYFGIKKGSTAIDKFNKMFYSECFKNDKNPFTFSIESRGQAYCHSENMYRHTEDSYGYIRFTSDDIERPYSYKLYDSYGDVLIEEQDIDSNRIVIGGRMADGSVVCNNFGAITYQNEPTSAICSASTGEYVDCTYNESRDSGYIKIENENYVLEITDFNGRTLSEEVNIAPQDISFDYEVRNLGTRFYNVDLSRIDYICDRDNDFYGIIRINNFSIDGDVFKIISANIGTYTDGSGYTIYVSGTGATPSAIQTFGNHTVNVVFRLSSLQEIEVNNTEAIVETKDCMCDNTNNVPYHDYVNIDVFSANTEDGTFEFTVYRPYTYQMSMTLVCDGMEVTASTVTQNISVGNGEEFDATLNEMPVKFMLGTVSDGQGSPIANRSNFYRTTGVDTATGDGLRGWYGLHKETTYKFTKTTVDDDMVWSKYVNYNDITYVGDRRKILKYKFDRMFQLSNVAYVSTNASSEFRYNTVGGMGVTLYRALSPDYYGTNLGRMWVYKDTQYVVNRNSTPNIVGYNYYWDVQKDRHGGIHNDTSPNFNGMFAARTGFVPPYYNYNSESFKYLGNYFAAFTKNGRYTSTTQGDCSINAIQIPTHSAVNIYDGTWKPLDEDKEETNYGVKDALKHAHTTNTHDGTCNFVTQPYLRAMFVDRKLDYDLVLWTNNPFRLRLYDEGTKENPNIENKKKNDILNNSRISGITYNGVEMSYDDRYNIISADTNTEDGTATSNNNLEYSYILPNTQEGNAITVFNESPIVPRRFYRASMNDMDIRDYFWSNTANNYVRTLPFSDGLYVLENGFMLYEHNNSEYNGDFSVDNYPTKRVVDIGNISGDGAVNLSIASCSYKMSANIKRDVITAKTVASGDSVKMQISPLNLISFVKPSEGNDAYANITFGTEDGSTFTASTVDLAFKYLQQSTNSKFVIYPRYPRIIRVAPYGQNDAITYLKTAVNDLDTRIDNITLECFNKKRPPVTIVSQRGNVIVDNLSEWGDFDTGLNVEGYGPYFIYDTSKKGRLSLKDEEITRLTMKSTNLNILDAKLFALLHTMDYYGKDMHRINHVETLEISHIFDARNTILTLGEAFVKVSASNAHTDVTKVEGTTEVSVDLTKAEMVVNIPDGEGGTTPVDVTVNSSPPPSSSPLQNGRGEGETEVQSFYQVVTFKLKISNGTDNLNQAITNVSNLSGYILIFRNATRKLTVTPSVIVDDENGYIELKTTLSAGDGIFADRDWKGNTHVDLIVDVNGFTYKLTFNLTCGTQAGYDEQNNRFSGVGEFTTPITIS